MADEPTKPSEPIAASGGSVDFSTYPKEAQDLFNKLLEDKRQANAEAQKAKEKIKALADEKANAERAALEEQGQYKAAYEKEKANREKAETEAQAKLSALLRKTIGLEAGLPEALYSRLQGASEDELRADAETLKGVIPQGTQKPPPSGTQNNTTSIPRGTPSGRTDEQIEAWIHNKDNVRSSNEPRQDGDIRIYGG